MTNPFGAFWRRVKIEWQHSPLLSRLRTPPPGDQGEYVPGFDNSLPKGMASYGPGSAKQRRRITDWRKPKPE